MAGRVFVRSLLRRNTVLRSNFSRKCRPKQRNADARSRFPCQGLAWPSNDTHIGSRKLAAGVEANQVRGASDEIAFTSGRASSFIDAGGRQATIAVYFGDVIKVNSRLFISAAARVDHWRNYAAFSASRPLTSPGITTTTTFLDPRSTLSAATSSLQSDLSVSLT